MMMSNCTIPPSPCLSVHASDSPENQNSQSPPSITVLMDYFIQRTNNLLLSIFTLMLGLSHIWSAGAPSNWQTGSYSLLIYSHLFNTLEKHWLKSEANQNKHYVLCVCYEVPGAKLRTDYQLTAIKKCIRCCSHIQHILFSCIVRRLWCLLVFIISFHSYHR